jgi:transcriptional regulator with XRE-family HTH domain
MNVIGPPTVVAQSLRPGDYLRRLRSQRGITAREVEDLSQIIAREQNNQEFAISHGRIIQVETNDSTPSIYKLCSLSVIYRVPLNELLGRFVDLGKLASYELQRDQTRLLRVEVEQPGKHMSFPVRFDPRFNVDQTNLLSRMVQVWGDVPVALIQHLNLRSMQYGLIGLSDYTMYPLLKPGSFVQIDDTQRKVLNPHSSTEYERPIYFVELRDGYLCAWCEMQKGQLLVLPHSLSPCKVRVFAHPAEAEIVGRVVAVAARLAPILEQANLPTAPILRPLTAGLGSVVAR